jgi:hypothetical protein
MIMSLTIGQILRVAASFSAPSQVPILALIKKLLVKELCGRCFICLKPPPLLRPHNPPLTHCIRVYSILINTGKGGGGTAYQREG